MGFLLVLVQLSTWILALVLFAEVSVRQFHCMLHVPSVTASLLLGECKELPWCVRNASPTYTVWQENFVGSKFGRLFENDIYNTVWPEILAGNLFWRIGSFESNPPIFPSAKLFTVCRYMWRHQYVVHHHSKCPHEIFKLRKNGTKIVQIWSNISWFQLSSMYYGSKRTQQCLHY